MSSCPCGIYICLFDRRTVVQVGTIWLSLFGRLEMKSTYVPGSTVLVYIVHNFMAIVIPSKCVVLNRDAQRRGDPRAAADFPIELLHYTVSVSPALSDTVPS